MSMTVCAPTSLVMRTEPPPPTKIPREPSGSAKKVLSSATRMWQVVASSSPPPTTAPCRAATMGTRPNSIVVNTLCQEREWCTPSTASISFSELKSSPAQKCSPSPSITTAFVLAGSSSKRCASAAMTPSLMALRFLGRVRRMMLMLPRCSTETSSSVGTVFAGGMVGLAVLGKGCGVMAVGTCWGHVAVVLRWCCGCADNLDYGYCA